MQRALPVLIALLLVAAFRLSDGPVILANEASYSFGREMVFTAEVRSDDPIQQAALWLTTAGGREASFPVAVNVGSNFTLEARRDIARDPLFPFAPVAWRWEMVTASGNRIVSASQSIVYADDRYEWHNLVKGRISISWVEGEAVEAEKAADLLGVALANESADLNAPIPQAVRLYLYPNLADFQSALGAAGGGWEGGRTDPGSGVILAAAAPDSAGRKTLAILLPHEGVHLLLETAWGDAYARIPAWLGEGLAVGYEMEPRPEMDALFQDAVRMGGLLPLATLCQSMPGSGNAPLLAYAESRSFVDYLRRTFGLEAVRSAIGGYAGGTPCTGVYGNSGLSLPRLEADWLRSIGAPAGGPTVSAGFVVGAAVAVLFIVLFGGWLLQRRRKRRLVEGVAR